MAALFTARSVEDAALRIVVRHLVDELGRCCPDGLTAYRSAFLDLCVDSAEMAMIAGDHAEDDRTAILVYLRAFVDPVESTRRDL